MRSAGEQARRVAAEAGECGWGAGTAGDFTGTAAAGLAWTVPSEPTVQEFRGQDLGGDTKAYELAWIACLVYRV